jgi:5-formyltetrahydrofolate cyclo-ligase
LAYDFQIVSEIPTHGKDIRVHKIITEKEIIEC